MLRQPDGNRGIVILIQHGELFQQIGAKQFRVSDGGGIATAMGETTPGPGF
jgi:hypothetical protein